MLKVTAQRNEKVVNPSLVGLQEPHYEWGGQNVQDTVIVCFRWKWTREGICSVG
jgi:hypothetical protein